MVAVPIGHGFPEAVTGERSFRYGNGQFVEEIAERWAALVPGEHRLLSLRLVSVLRRMAAVITAVGYDATTGRDIGADVFDSGLCELGPDTRVADWPQPGEVLQASLRLLREDAAAAFGVTDREVDRFTDLLDDVAAGFVGALTARLGARTALTASSEIHYRTVYQQGAVGIGVVGLDGLVVDLNPALCRMFGVPWPIDRPRPLTDFVHPDDLSDVIDRFRRLVRGRPEVVRMELRFVRPDGLMVYTHLVASLVRDEQGRPQHVIGVVDDQSERNRLRLRLQRASYHDQLTQLPNRSLSEQWVRRAFEPGGPGHVGICALDLDGLTQVNDTFGHRVGDQLLLAVAARLQLAAGDSLVTRTGGDEFSVLVQGEEGLPEVCRTADRLLAAFDAPFQIGRHSLTMSASIGVAESPTALACPGELMRSADVALSWAKTHGGGRRIVFDPERDAGESLRYALLTGLPGAVGRDEFRLDYQPLVSLPDRRLLGAEALVRWDHPVHGLLGPGRFIELAEHSGSIVQLGEWILRTACAQTAQWWQEQGADAPFVSVNVSPVQLADPGFVDVVTAVLAETGLPAHLLQLEITEQAVLGDEAMALGALNALADLGIRLALDDFGTGYSSLVWLRRLPVHALKIDGSFIDGLRHPTPDPADAAIVGALIDLAHALGLEVTAEWVETETQAERLAELGCDLGQGRWFGDPRPARYLGVDRPA